MLISLGCRRRVGDPCVTSKLPPLLATCGFEVIEIRPIAKIVLSGSADWIWPTTYFATQARRLAERGLLTDAEVAAFDEEWRQLTKTPGSFYCPPTMAAVIVRRL